MHADVLREGESVSLARSDGVWWNGGVGRKAAPLAS